MLSMKKSYHRSNERSAKVADLFWVRSDKRTAEARIRNALHQNKNSSTRGATNT